MNRPKELLGVDIQDRNEWGMHGDKRNLQALNLKEPGEFVGLTASNAAKVRWIGNRLVTPDGADVPDKARIFVAGARGTHRQFIAPGSDQHEAAALAGSKAGQLTVLVPHTYGSPKGNHYKTVGSEGWARALREAVARGDKETAMDLIEAGQNISEIPFNKSNPTLGLEAHVKHYKDKFAPSNRKDLGRVGAAYNAFAHATKADTATLSAAYAKNGSVAGAIPKGTYDRNARKSFYRTADASGHYSGNSTDGCGVLMSGPGISGTFHGNKVTKYLKRGNEWRCARSPKVSPRPGYKRYLGIGSGSANDFFQKNKLGSVEEWQPGEGFKRYGDATNGNVGYGVRRETARVAKNTGYGEIDAAAA